MDFIKNESIENERWIDYAKEREIAVEEYVRMIKSNRRINRFITLMMIRAVFLR
jgi:hypothetical protein